MGIYVFILFQKYKKGNKRTTKATCPERTQDEHLYALNEQDAAVRQAQALSHGHASEGTPNPSKNVYEKSR